MPRGNPSPKVAITVDPQIHEMAIAAAARDGESLSAWITQAIRQRLQNEDGLRAILEWELENGAFTAEELQEAREYVLDEIRRYEQRRRKQKRRAKTA